MGDKDEKYSEEEADRRFKEAIRHALTTPHKPKASIETPGSRGDAQRRRRAKARPKS